MSPRIRACVAVVQNVAIVSGERFTRSTRFSSKEVGGVSEEFERDEFGRVHKGSSVCVDSIGAVEFDPRLLREPRQREIDFMSQLDVYRKRPRQWASSVPGIPTERVDEGGVEQPEYYSRSCEKELKRSSSNVKCVTVDVMSRKIMFWDASAMRCVASATSEVASELPPDEQAVCQDLLGELSSSLSGMREAVCIWEKLQNVLIHHKPKSSAVVCCQERELCGFVHDRFITFDSDSLQLMWIESRLKEELNLRRADFGVDDGDGKTVVILTRSVTWSNQLEVEADSRHRDILFVQVNLDGFDMCIVLCYGCEIRTDTPRNSIRRTSLEFGSYANVEILGFINVCIVTCQTEEGPMKGHQFTQVSGRQDRDRRRCGRAE